MIQNTVPPMGWNSYDYYDTTVNEEQVKANADYMAENLLPFGYRYVVVDIEWYAYHAGSQRERYQYIPFEQVEMDEYSRLLPCSERFPSSQGGAGFRPLADYVHQKGLLFGIHIMRGIPRIAAHLHGQIKDSTHTANEIADPSSICSWNPDMYGVVPNAPGAKEYYQSIIDLYADWGVDFIKCDDICRMDAVSSKEEIRLLSEAIDQCGRPMILSLSPGPALLEEAEFYKKYANMWRITDDFWDGWESLRHMFDRCRDWQGHVTDGGYPDCDMLPVGIIGKGFGEERTTHFTDEEQRTMLSLWCLCRSPLMIGAELTKLDQKTLALLTNSRVLHLLQDSKNAHEIKRTEEWIVWRAESREGKHGYQAVFNLTDSDCIWKIEKEMTDLWTEVNYSDTMNVNIPPHGCLLSQF